MVDINYLILNSYQKMVRPSNNAGFWVRVAAFIVDFTILSIISSFLIRAFNVPINIVSDDYSPLLFIIHPYSMLINWAYFSLLESSKFKATLGKKIFKIEVVDLSQKQISIARATGRFFAKFLSFFPFGLGLLLLIFTKHKQALHDLIAGTVVKKIVDY